MEGNKPTTSKVASQTEVSSSATETTEEKIGQLLPTVEDEKSPQVTTSEVEDSSAVTAAEPAAEAALEAELEAAESEAKPAAGTEPEPATADTEPAIAVTETAAPAAPVQPVGAPTVVNEAETEKQPAGPPEVCAFPNADTQAWVTAGPYAVELERHTTEPAHGDVCRASNRAFCKFNSMQLCTPVHYA